MHTWQEVSVGQKKVQTILPLDNHKWVSEECKKVKIEIITRGKLYLAARMHQFYRCYKCFVTSIKLVHASC